MMDKLTVFVLVSITWLLLGIKRRKVTDKFEVTLKITLSNLTEAANVYREVQLAVWDKEVDPEQVVAQCTLNGSEFFTVNEHGQKLTIDDYAFGIGG